MRPRTLMRSLLLGTAALLFVIAASAVLWRFRIDAQPVRLAAPVLVDVNSGQGARTIAFNLTAAGLLRSPWPFLAWHYLRPSRPKLKAGEYRFEGDLSFQDVYGKIARGEVHYHVLVIPEGYNLQEIAVAVEQTGLVKAADFLTASRNPTLIADIAPQARSLEGFLFPDTYHFTRKTTARDMVQAMLARFRQVYGEVAKGDASLKKRALEVVTLASLVEKETGKAGERSLVAGVFQNRLNAGIALQCDPTVAYAALLEGAYRGTIYASDLRRASPYNTYVNRGLPPGPIASPGRASLEAAARPAETDYLFFVAGEDGGHIFSRTLAEHNRHVISYRRKSAARTHG